MMRWHKGIRFRKRRKRRIAIVSLIFALFLIGILGIMMTGKKTKVVLKVKSVSILQGEELPKLSAEAACENKKACKKKLGKNYTIDNLIKDLNDGKGYELKQAADNQKEGSYSIQVVWDKEFEQKLNKEWKKKLTIEIENATLTVKNKYGTWDKEKFCRLDGSYVTSDFIVSKGKTYYFDENGEKVTGWQEIQGATYFFNEKGMMHTGWKETKEGNYYFQEDGKMTVGWLELDDGTYYFDQKGKMVTGELVIGKVKCVFAKDGKLESKENKVDLKKPMIALTFDDGPGKYTDTLLNKLDEYDARATFFMLGSNVEKYPDLLQKMDNIGCELANHSTTHTSLVKLDKAGIQSEIETTENAIREAVGHGSSMLRPPYGAFNDEVKSVAGMPIMMWSLDTLDWKKKDAEKIKNYVLDNVSDGDVVLMHDIHSFSVDAALELIPELINRGYQLVTVSELAEARGVELENGVKYSQFYKQ